MKIHLGGEECEGNDARQNVRRDFKRYNKHEDEVLQANENIAKFIPTVNPFTVPAQSTSETFHPIPRRDMP
jgi:hypothetical protein